MTNIHVVIDRSGSMASLAVDDEGTASVKEGSEK